MLIADVDEVVDHRSLEGFRADFAGPRMRTFRFFPNYIRRNRSDLAAIIQ